MPSVVVFGDIVEFLDLAREEAPAEGGVGDDGDVEFGAGGRNAVLEDLGLEKAEFHFDGRDLGYGGCASDGVRAAFREGDAAQCAGFDELLCRADSDLDGCLGVDSCGFPV